MAGIKAITPNEVREYEDLDPVPWGWEPIETPNNTVQDSTSMDHPADSTPSDHATEVPVNGA